MERPRPAKEAHRDQQASRVHPQRILSSAVNNLTSEPSMIACRNPSPKFLIDSTAMPAACRVGRRWPTTILFPSLTLALAIGQPLRKTPARRAGHCSIASSGLTTKPRPVLRHFVSFPLSTRKQTHEIRALPQRIPPAFRDEPVLTHFLPRYSLFQGYRSGRWHTINTRCVGNMVRSRTVARHHGLGLFLTLLSG